MAPRPNSPPLALVLVTALLVATALGSLLALIGIEPPTVRWRTSQVAHSWLDNDFPEEFPMPPLDTVKLTVEDTVHFQIDDDAAYDEWESIFPSGGGFAYLGPNKRKFSLAMFHSLHCMQQIRESIMGHDDPLAPHSHVHHCINYLRQLILCQPDLTLEPQSYFLHDQLHKQGVDGLGVTHTCRDWTQVYAALEDNWAEYQIWLNGTVAPW